MGEAMINNEDQFGLVDLMDGRKVVKCTYDSQQTLFNLFGMNFEYDDLGGLVQLNALTGISEDFLNFINSILANLDFFIDRDDLSDLKGFLENHNELPYKVKYNIGKINFPTDLETKITRLDNIVDEICGVPKDLFTLRNLIAEFCRIVTGSDERIIIYLNYIDTYIEENGNFEIK